MNIYMTSSAEFIVGPSDCEEVSEYSGFPPSIAVVVHVFYMDQLPKLIEYLSNIPSSFDCFVSVKPDAIADVHLAFRALNLIDLLTVKSFPNVGRDMAPFLVGFSPDFGDLSNYDLVLKLHTKKSLHNHELRYWFPSILDGLVGSSSIVRHHWAILMESNVGITFTPPPQPVLLSIERDSSWGGQLRNFHRCSRERERLGLLDLNPNQRFSFPVGSMFWCKPAVLKPLFELNLRWSSFDREAGQLDGTLAHSLERLLGLVCTEKIELRCIAAWIPGGEWQEIDFHAS